MRPSDGKRLFQPIAANCKRSDSELGRLLQHAGKALLDRIGGLSRDLARELPKLPALRSGGFEVLAALLSGELQDFRGHLCTQEMGEKIKDGAGVGAGEFDDFGRIVRSALCVGR